MLLGYQPTLLVCPGALAVVNSVSVFIVVFLLGFELDIQTLEVLHILWLVQNKEFLLRVWGILQETLYSLHSTLCLSISFEVSESYL